MRTDPKNTAYVVVEGATKRDTGEDKVLPEERSAILTDEERDALRKNAFASLEKTIADRERLKLATERIDDLADLSKKHWDDPYAQNQKLRRAFRVGRKQREMEAAATEGLKDRMGLGMELLPEREDDAKRAALVDFGRDQQGEGIKALSKPLFAIPNPKSTSTTTKTHSTSTLKDARYKAEKEASRRKETFVTQFISNTRAAQDPFLGGGGDKGTNKVSLGIVKKRKRDVAPGADEGFAQEPEAKVAVSAVPTVGLVEYDSD